MARSIATIYQQLLDSKNADANLAGLDSPSQVSYFNLWLYIQAVSANLLEQVIDIFITDEIEPTVSAIPPSTPAWLQAQVFLFQYSATTPQIINLVNFIPTYPIIDATLRLVTQCSVQTDANKNVSVKVAKESPPVKLTATELLNLQSYLDVINSAGIQTTAVSLDPDKLFVEAEIFYDGQYAPVISENVIAGINAFLAAIPFNGIMRLSSLEEAILDIQGVTDVEFSNVRTRADATPLGSAAYLVQAKLQITRYWQTIAGYIVEEDTAGNTFTDKLTFTADS